ncbi:SRPBCC family protein [Halovivax sp.]|uniref:SRPBCC family protein n=1 Tax=Halovivax sp. TaxID=1935978 RepID=UPI0025BA95C4|nr:SRPBCC family protein [Halovivax sp.]
MTPTDDSTTTVERTTRIDAPLEDVWSFHADASGLERLTPSWIGLRLESAVDADGSSGRAELRSGTELVYSVRPFGIGPRRYVRARIVDRWRTDERAGFRDELADGPLEHWEHEHAFVADGDGTFLSDRVSFALPGGRAGAAVAPAAKLGLAVAFRDRHRRTKALLER